MTKKQKIILWLAVLFSLGLSMYVGMVVQYNFIDAPTKTVAPSTAYTGPDDYSLWVRVNKERVKAGLQPLALDANLETSATEKCADMVKNNYFDHFSPSGVAWRSFIEKYEVTPYRGENLSEGYDTSDKVVDAWMNSAGHKANILNPHYQDVGYGVCTSSNEVYVVQHFTGQ